MENNIYICTLQKTLTILNTIRAVCVHSYLPSKNTSKKILTLTLLN